MFRTFDHQKGCLDSEIFDSGSINAPLVGEDFYRRRNLTRVTDEPEVIPGKKSLGGSAESERAASARIS